MRLWVGRLAALVLVWWVAAQAAKEWQAVSALHLSIRWPTVIVASLCVGLALLQVVAAWRLVLRWLGQTITLKQSFAIIGISSLGRYMPGKVWVLVGKVGFLQRLGASYRVAVQSLLWELALATLAAGVLCVLPWSSSPALRQLWPVGLGAVAGVLGVVAWSSWRSGSAGGLQVIGLIGQYLLLWLLFGAGVFLIGQAILPVSHQDVVDVIRAYAIAHTASVVVVWVPNGIGVREWCLHWLLAGTSLQPVAGVVALVMRAVVTVCELTYAGVAWWMFRQAVIPKPLGRVVGQAPPPPAYGEVVPTP